MAIPDVLVTLRFRPVVEIRNIVVKSVVYDLSSSQFFLSLLFVLKQGLVLELAKIFLL